MPMLAASYIPKNTNVILQSENGILGLVSERRRIILYLLKFG